MSTGINIAPSSDLVVGTTAVTSGTDGRVFFQAGGVVQQDANFTFDNTLKRLTLKAVGTAATDIPFAVRNSADTADLISFRGDGSEWIQSVPFRHAGNLTGGTNTAQSLYIGYNSRGIASSGFRNVIIGTGAGGVISTNDSVCIGHNASAFNTSIAIGSNASAAANNYCVMGSESYPFSAMSIGTGGTVTSLAAVQNMIFSVGGVAGGFTSNSDLSSKFFRIQSQGGSGTGNSAPIQFSVAPSGAGGFTANAFVIPFEVRGDAAGLNHYQLSTPRVPSASITDGYIQYSADRGGIAGKASAHFRAEDGTINVIGDLSGFGTSTPGARLDVRAQGALSTDIAFRVRNSADSANIIEQRGDGNLVLNGNPARMTYSSGNNTGSITHHSRADSVVNLKHSFTFFQSGFNDGSQSTAPKLNMICADITSYGINNGFHWYFNNNLNPLDSERAMWLTPKKTLSFFSGTGPDAYTSKADSFELYSADIVGGNASPHFRTENGSIVKLYQETTAVTAAAFVSNTSLIFDDSATYGGYTMGQVVAALKAQGLLA